MAKINTTNYQPVAAWNGTQDLLVVEQPDGTKVATPEQVRQYILSNMDDVPTEGSENIVSSSGVATSLSDLQTQIDTLHGDNKTIIPANADINNIQYTAVGQYITNGNNKNIQNVPNAVKNLSFYMNVINSLTNETTQISSAWKERIQIIIPIDASAIYIREVKSNASVSDITYGSWQTVLTDKSGTINYTASDITELHQSITINEFSLRKWGRMVTLGLNFSVSAYIPVFTQLFKLPSGIVSFGRVDSIGIFTTKTLQAGLSITTGGYVMANSSIDTGTYYMGQIVFLCQ